MSSEQNNAIEKERLALEGQLKTAETALQGVIETEGFGATLLAHLKRAVAHVSEARVALNQPRNARSVHQLVEDLRHFENVMDEFKRPPQKRSIRP